MTQSLGMSISQLARCKWGYSQGQRNDQIVISAVHVLQLVQTYELLLGQCNKMRIHVTAQSAREN